MPLTPDRPKRDAGGRSEGSTDQCDFELDGGLATVAQTVSLRRYDLRTLIETSCGCTQELCDGTPQTNSLRYP